jgi:FlaG/FlaF family flagellin (archaellin)
MFRHKAITLVLAAACATTVLPAAAFGSIFHKDAPAASSSAKVEVQFNNTADSPRLIKVGGKVKTLDSKKVTKMEIPAGTTVTVYSSMKSHNPGDVLIVVDAAHPNQTVTVD